MEKHIILMALFQFIVMFRRELGKKKVPHLVGHLYLTDYLNGAAYIMPPLVHKAFRPRARPNWVLGPTLRS
jgi:hypothetical protein